MFKKEKCPNCNNKISRDYTFCPHCSKQLKDKREGDFGLLGRNDYEPYEEIGLPRGLSVIFNSLLKSLNKQMEDIERKNNQEGSRPKNRSIGISIHTSGNKPPQIKFTSFNKESEKHENKNKEVGEKISLPSTDSKKFIGLPKKNPETNVRRLSDKVIYEIDLPGVKSLDDISIIQLENSIEIKAFAKDHVFHKIIPISLPIKDYSFSKKKFTLELDIQQ